jgi:hypothetical protein
MNYCKWKTVRENPNDSIEFIYRVAHCTEWLAAKHSVDQASTPHDFGDKYAEWLLNSMDESVGMSHVQYMHLHVPSDPPSIQRKLVVSNSFLYQLSSPKQHCKCSY